MKQVTVKRNVLAVFLSLAWIPMHAQSEDALQRLDKAFEAAFARNRPDCVLDSAKARESRGPAIGRSPVEHYREWRRGGAKISVYYSIEASAEAAQRVLRGGLNALEMGSPGPVRELADEAYLLARYGAQGDSAVWLRRGAVLVSVYTTVPPELAKEIASMLCGEVDKELRPKHP